LKDDLGVAKKRAARAEKLAGMNEGELRPTS
jgi:hypothetical protein